MFKSALITILLNLMIHGSKAWGRQKVDKKKIAMAKTAFFMTSFYIIRKIYLLITQNI